MFKQPYIQNNHRSKLLNHNYLCCYFVRNTMSGFKENEPSYTISFATEVKVNKTHYILNTTSPTSITISSATVNNSSDSSSGNIDMLFTWVLIACVLLAVLMIVSVFLVIIYWRVKTRRRLDDIYNACFTLSFNQLTE